MRFCRTKGAVETFSMNGTTTIRQLAEILSLLHDQSASIQLMDDDEFKIVKMDNGKYVIAPMDWKGWQDMSYARRYTKTDENKEES